MSRFNRNWDSDKLNSRNFDNYLDSIVSDTPHQDEIIQMQPVSSLQDVENGSPENGLEMEQTPEEPSMPQKMDLMLLTKGWNDKNERIVISIGENAASYKWMHEKSAAQYAMYNKIFGVLMIVFSTVLTAETVVPNDNNNLALSIVRRVITYIITLLSVIANFLKFAKVSEQHMSSALAFSKLYHDIQQQMCMYRRDRRNATKYVADVLKEYDSLVVTGPAISTKIITEFKNAFKSSDISLPDIADRIQKIEIVSETPAQQSIIPQLSANNVSKGIKNTPNNTEAKRYGRYGLNNLQEIHDCFQISGDISDKDIQNATQSQLRDMRNKYLTGKSDFEYQRFKQHADEND